MRLLVLCVVLILGEPLAAVAFHHGLASSGRSFATRGLAAQEASEIGPDEYAARRDRMLEEIPDGILVLHARTAPKEMEQWGFIQDPTFLYFTGLAEIPGAILAIDGVGRETRLFVPPPPLSFGVAVRDVVADPGSASARALGLDAVQPWDRFTDWLDARIADGVAKLYVDEPRRPEATGVPAGLASVSGPLGLWRASLEARWPNVAVVGGRPAIQALRWVKSPSEVAILERNARSTATALLVAARTLRPGLRQRTAEAAVVAACIESGAEGPSFWPWVMSGPNTQMDRLVSAFFRYEHLDRQMGDGELVRVDIGCGGGLYGGDVGRTFPVSGHFSDGQREAWNLLIDAYRAGMSAMSAGVGLDVVREASRARVAEARASLMTATGREAAATILAGGDAVWHIHGVGIESGEEAGSVLEVGSVLAFEPMVSVGPDVFYLEDMILITATGHRVLSGGLPYTAEEIEAAMAGGH